MIKFAEQVGFERVEAQIILDHCSWMFSEEGKKVMFTACCEAAGLYFTFLFWGNACNL